MKKLTFTFRKYVALMGFMLVSNMSTFAQMNRITEFENTYVKPYFPIVAAIVFIIGALMNMGKLFGEHRDIKSFFTNIMIYLGALFFVAALYVVIRGITL